MSHRKNTPTHPLKTQAKALRTHLGSLGWDLTHSQSLEAIAKTHGYKDWNTASASVPTPTKHMDFRPTQLEHWLVPQNSDAAYQPVYNRVMKLLSKDAKVALFDCGHSVRPERWKDAYSLGGFGIHNTTTQERLWESAGQVARHYADLIVILKPGHLGYVQSRDWFSLVDEIMKISPDTHVLVVSRGTDDDGGVVTAVSSPEWTRMASQEWYMGETRGCRLQKMGHLKDLRCPRCSGEIERRPGQFFSRSTGGYPGLVCVGCESLWDDPNASFMGAISRKEVSVNGKKFRVGDTLSYEEIADMAGEPHYASMTYFCKASERKGSLVGGETVRVGEGMRFTVTVTGNA